MATEEKIAVLTLRRMDDLTDKSRRYLAWWLRQKATEIEYGSTDRYAATFRASLWPGRGLGWKRAKR
jgi:hypothetical protein